MMDMQLFVGSGVFVFGVWALKTVISLQDVSEDEGCDYEDVVRQGSTCILVTNSSGSAVTSGS